MATPIPLPGTPQHEDAQDSPEVLMINALLEAPEGFKPQQYGVTKEMLAGWQKAWQFCVDHQERTGSPPARGVFARSFPDFEIMADVNPTWAAWKLIAAHQEREMRRGLRGALALLNQGDVESAQEELKGLSAPLNAGKLRGLNVLDVSTVESEHRKIAYPFPWDTLQRVTGGFGLGELVYWAARLGQGKSWLLTYIAAALAESGATVGICTLEMPKLTYTRRIQAVLARGDREVQAKLRSRLKEDRLAALAALPSLPGRMEVLDPSDTHMSTRTVQRLAAEFQFIVVDHVGLLHNAAGKRPIEDWRVAAEVSNVLKEVTLSHSVGILAAAQINREGESNGWTPPKVSNLAGADDLGRDADTAVTMRRMGERSMRYHAAKVRDGVPVSWYTKFEPAVADFSQIDKDAAMQRAREDEDRAADA